MMAELEAAEQELVSMRVAHGPTGKLDVRLGALLVLRNIKVGDLMREWDDDGSGTIDLREWRANLQRLGLQAPITEYDELFRQLDTDASGELIVAEVKSALKALTEAASQAASAEKVQAKLVAERRKVARAAQAEATRARMEIQRGPPATTTD